MRGAVAAGHPLTAEAGANVLRAGGNAVDACIGAAFTSWVCESMLTGPGGGAFLLAGGVLFDGFVAVPQLLSEAELIELAVDFDGETAQHFRTGAAAVAVPGTTLALEAAHARFGSMPWGELVEPAARLARSGVVLTDAQAYLHQILDPLLRHSREGDAFYGGRTLRAGERLVLAELADTLDRIAADGARVLYGGGFARAIAAHVSLSLDDLAAYRVVEREPLSIRYCGCEFRTNPPPSSGGRLIAIGLQALGEGDVLHAMEVMEEARIPAAGGTTHISVVDARGDAASLSCSLGSGSGVVVPGTGIHLNNMLGEADLRASARPGERLTSMMAPSLVLQDGRPRLVIGSAGSERLRGAVLQVVANVVARGMDVEAAVDAPRMHLADGVVHVEPGIEYDGENVVRWRDKNLYFGGVSAVEVRDDGQLAAAGDPRRGGAGVVVS
ncbi:MAG TPA: gamma-glutamyltransferase [Gaiellaceae bacterium]|nr:gamma-glutamyltransferase [Gaiellaceae bacterium]